MPNGEVTIKNQKGYTAEITGKGEILTYESNKRGSYIINDTTEATMNTASILVLSDAVFTSIKVGGVDIKASLISTPASAVKAGAIITVPDDVFSSVKLASGSVQLKLV